MYIDSKTCVLIFIFSQFCVIFITMCLDKVLTEFFDDNRLDTNRH